MGTKSEIWRRAISLLFPLEIENDEPQKSKNILNSSVNDPNNSPEICSIVIETIDTTMSETVESDDLFDLLQSEDLIDLLPESDDGSETTIRET